MPRRFPALACWIGLAGFVIASRLPAQLCNAHTTLHDQLDLAGTAGVPITDFLPATEVGRFDSAAADDLRVPADTVWYVDQIRAVLGPGLSGGDGDSGVFHLSIHLEEEGLPGPAVCEHRGLGVDLGSFPIDTLGRRTVAIPLPEPCTLCAGLRYWVALQRLESPSGSSRWIQRSSPVLQPALWQNPGGGLGTPCGSWGAASQTCHQGDGLSPDLAFALEGVSRTLAAGEVPGDLNGDRCADLVFERSDLTGLDVLVWVMNGPTRVAEVILDTVTAAPNTHVVGLQDLTGDGRSDLILQDANPPEGVVLYLPMEGLVPAGGPQGLDGTPPSIPIDRAIVSSGAFSAPGEPDLVCHGPQGTVLIWDLLRATYGGALEPDPPKPVDGGWVARGAGDFNGDGDTDLLFVNEDSRRLVMWELDKDHVRLSGGFTVPSQPHPTDPLPWQLQAVGDYGIGGPPGVDPGAPVCGALDLVFQHQVTGELRLWHLDFARTRTSEATPLPAFAPAGWRLVGPR